MSSRSWTGGSCPIPPSRFVTNLSDDAIAVLGEMVKLSLGIGDQANLTVLGRQWVDDVTETCWRLELANHEDRFGKTE